MRGSRSWNGVRAGAVGFGALLLVGLVGAPQAHAQDTRGGHRVVLGGQLGSGAVVVTPSTGRPGDEVFLRPTWLPAETSVQIMIGALQQGFEVVSKTATDAFGELIGPRPYRVSVPDWVEPDRTYLWIITDLFFNPLAVADIFHPAGEDGLVIRQGAVEVEEPGCPMLRNDASELYFLTGDVGALRHGDEVTVSGEVVAPGTCGRLPTLRVERMHVAGR